MTKGIIDTSYGDLTGSIFKNDITIYNEGLGSLEGCPKEVWGNLNVQNNRIKDLEFAPKFVKLTFNISDNSLTSLNGAEDMIVGLNFDCRKNPNLQNPVREIISKRIKAKRYFTDAGVYSYEDIKDEMDNLDKRVTRKSMRTLLGLDK